MLADPFAEPTAQVDYALGACRARMLAPGPQLQVAPYSDSGVSRVPSDVRRETWAPIVLRICASS